MGYVELVVYKINCRYFASSYIPRFIGRFCRVLIIHYHFLEQTVFAIHSFLFNTSSELTMKYSIIVAAFAAFISSAAAADGVKGSAEGFAKGECTEIKHV